MNLETVEKEEVTILRFSGSFDTNTAPSVESQLKSMVTNRRYNLLLDFSNLDFISSAGIRVLLVIYKQLLGKGRMVICNSNEQVREVFEMTGLAGLIFNFYETEGQALENLNQD